jgi:flavin reductase (DIM6/NTAB) family NADH-FMN oxidoreductase RutF
MPAREGIVGPVPKGRDPDEYDRLRRRVIWAMPSGLYVVGTTGVIDGESRKNVMTLNWTTQVATDPKLMGVSIERSAVTARLIETGGVFSLCLLRREDRAVARKFVKPAKLDAEASTLNGFGFHQAVTGAPVLDLALAYLDCELRHRLELGSHTLFVGEVVDAAFQGSESDAGLRMEDTRMSYGG